MTGDLSEGRLDLWYARPDRAGDPQLLDRYRSLLAPAELVQLHRFRLDRLKRQHLLTRALVRTVLSYYTGEDPAAWTFRHNAYGKPSVASPEAPGLEFNLSHTDGLVVCGVTRGCPLGVDVEAVDRSVAYLDLAGRFFAKSEADELASLPPAARPERFFEYWTLKESYIKARGMGLSIPLDDFAFALAPGEPPRIAFTRPGLNEPGRWRFARFRLDGHYQIAVALGRPADEPLEIRAGETVPLTGVRDVRVLPASASSTWTL